MLVVVMYWIILLVGYVIMSDLQIGNMLTYTIWAIMSLFLSFCVANNIDGSGKNERY